MLKQMSTEDIDIKKRKRWCDNRLSKASIRQGIHKTIGNTGTQASRSGQNIPIGATTSDTQKKKKKKKKKRKEKKKNEKERAFWAKHSHRGHDK